MPGISKKLMSLIGDEPVNKWAIRNDLPAQTVHEWIKHDRMPRGENLDALCAATGRPREWWQDGNDESTQLQYQNGMQQEQSVSAQGATIYVAEQPTSQYVHAEPVVDKNGLKFGLGIQSLAPSIAFITRILLVMKRLPWIPESIDDNARGQLVQRLFNMLTMEAASNDGIFDRLVDNDAALESALRYLWEVERCRSDPGASWSW